MLPCVAMFGFLTRLLAAEVTLGFLPGAVFAGCFDIVDDSDSAVLGLVRRRSLSNFGIAVVISPVEIAFRTASAMGESISIPGSDGTYSKSQDLSGIKHYNQKVRAKHQNRCQLNVGRDDTNQCTL